MKWNYYLIWTILILTPLKAITLTNIINADSTYSKVITEPHILKEYGYSKSTMINFFLTEAYQDEKDFSTIKYFGISLSRYIDNFRSRITFANYYEKFHTEEGGQNSFIFINADIELFYDYLSYRLGLLGLLAREGSSGPKGFAFPSAGLKVGYLKRIFLSVDFIDIYLPGLLTIALNYKFNVPYTFLKIGINYSDENNIFVEQKIFIFQLLFIDAGYIFKRKSLKFGVGIPF